MNGNEMIHRVKVLIEHFNHAKVEQLPYCSKSAGWQINKFYGKSTERKSVQQKLKQHFGEEIRIEHGHYSVQEVERFTCVVYGNFRTIRKEAVNSFYGFSYEVTIVMKNGIAERLILYGDYEEPVLCMVRSNEEHMYMLRESEIIYIESSHNSVIWHCRDREVKSRGTLKELDESLPEHFLRLQRGYIINVWHIKAMENREVTMDNGNILLIPFRTYYAKKKRIRELCFGTKENENVHLSRYSPTFLPDYRNE